MCEISKKMIFSPKNIEKMSMGSFNLTFSDCIKTLNANEIIGEQSHCGTTNDDVRKIHESINGSILYNLKDLIPHLNQNVEDAMILIIKNQFPNDSNNLLQTFINPEYVHDGNIIGIEWDKFTPTGALNKKFYKSTFADLGDMFKINSLANFKRGTMYNINKIPSLLNIKNSLRSILPCNFVVEASHFYDNEKSHKLFNHEKDKRCVTGLHLGEPMNINFKWYHKSIKCCDNFSIELNHGDIYIMSNIASGSVKDNVTKLFLKHSFGNHCNALR